MQVESSPRWSVYAGMLCRRVTMNSLVAAASWGCEETHVTRNCDMFWGLPSTRHCMGA
jgi:hypothetical protein